MISLPFCRTIAAPTFGSRACVKRSRQMTAKKSLLRLQVKSITSSACSKTLSLLSLAIETTSVKSIPLRSQRCPNLSTLSARQLSKSNSTAHEVSQRETLYPRIILASLSSMHTWMPLRNILASTKPMPAITSIASFCIRVSQNLLS